ncbi:RE1-silencing transcription factor B [Armadillidium nasatum]|uniref:RE1-silencing transcription factor B n=1 Tax=Armadillidium nasatum TaxID=96803 RepID=A0A5N5SLW7_9CRUS|nr:RE1-silencing transcription factor B [Armadillidium nasatum]
MFKGHWLEGAVEEEQSATTVPNTSQPSEDPVSRNPLPTPQIQDTKPVVAVNENQFKCPSCSYSCSKLWKLRNHEKVHFGDTNMKRNLSRHELNHSDTKKYSCDLCDYQNNSKVLYNKHKLSHSEKYKNSKFKCPRCIFATDERELWKNHVITHERITLHQCCSCEYATTKLSDIKRHRRTHLKNEPSYDGSSYPEPTPQQQHLSSRTPAINPHHFNGVEEKKPYQCDRCSYSSKLKGALNRHSLIHEETKALKCPECDYRTNFKNRLRDHQKIHVQIKDLKCSDCDFETKHKFWCISLYRIIEIKVHILNIGSLCLHIPYLYQWTVVKHYHLGVGLAYPAHVITLVTRLEYLLQKQCRAFILY